MSNPHINDNKSFTNGKYVRIGQINDAGYARAIDSATGQDLGRTLAFDKYGGCSDYISLSKYASDAIASKFTYMALAPYEIDDYLEYGHPIDYEGYQIIKTEIDNSVQWLWGNLEGGGLGLFTCDGYESGVYFIATYGVYYDENDENEKICCWVSNTPYTPAQLAQGYICYLYSASTDTLSGYYHWIYAYNYELGVAVGPNVNLTHYNYAIIESADLSEIKSNGYNNWLLVDYPQKCARTGGTNYPNAKNDIVPLDREITDQNYHLDHGSIHNESVYNPNDDGGLVEQEYPDGDFENWTDDVDYTDVEDFDVDAVNSGFVTLYNPSSANVQAFTDFLFTGITENMSIVLKRLISNPLDYVIGMNVVHYHPRVTLANQAIKFCGIDSGVSADQLKQFQVIDCGEIDINEQFETFLDYGGYSKFKLALPYCGVYPLETNEIQSSVMGIKYNIDNLTGACVAQVKITRKVRDHVKDDPTLDSVLYEFNGNVFSQVPLSAVDYRGTIQGIMQIASGVSSLTMGSSSGLGAVASGVMSLTPSVQHSGNMSTSFGYMGRQKPMLILERPMQAMPNEMGDREGFVSNIYVSKLNNVTGYNEIDPESFKTEFINCTDAERDEIVRLLSGGFII